MKFGFCWLQGVIVPKPVSSCHYQASATQIGEMPRCGRLRNFQNLDEVTNTQFSIQQEMKNPQTRGIGESTKH